jgi:hypothetical protein
MGTMEKHSQHIETQKTHQPLWLIWDLDGKYDHFSKHLSIGLWVVPKNKFGIISSIFNGNIPVWAWWNMHLIFSGDILADRWMDGFRILRAISWLRDQARPLWWDIEILAGNHEERMIGFLMGRYDETITDRIRWSKEWNTHQFQGIDELSEFGGDRSEILSNMRKSEKWTMILQEMRNMKLSIIHWDGIHFHTPPSRSMLDMIAYFYEKNGKDIISAIRVINQSWNTILQRVLLQERNINQINSKSMQSTLPAYRIYASTFINTLSGDRDEVEERGWCAQKNKWQIFTSYHRTYKYLRDAGITTIYHGHTDSIFTVNGFKVINMNHRSMLIPADIQPKSLSLISATRGNVMSTLQK